MSPQQTALAACCRRSVWRANPTASPLSQTCEAAPAAPRDVEDSVPWSSTSEAAPDELCDVEDSVPISSTSEAAPTGSVPHSEPIVWTVRHVTGTGSGLLGGIPRVVVQISALTLKGPL